MFVFGFLTVRHIHQSKARVAPALRAIDVSTTSNRPPKKSDRQLIRMLLVQCLVFIVTASPTSVQYIYASTRETMGGDNVFYLVAGFVALTVPSISFYLFTLSSKLFRQELPIKPFRLPRLGGP